MKGWHKRHEIQLLPPIERWQQRFLLVIRLRLGKRVDKTDQSQEQNDTYLGIWGRSGFEVGIGGFPIEEGRDLRSLPERGHGRKSSLQGTVLPRRSRENWLTEAREYKWRNGIKKEINERKDKEEDQEEGGQQQEQGRRQKNKETEKEVSR